MMWLLILWILGMLLWFVLSQQRAAITTQDVIALSLLCGIVVYCRRMTSKLMMFLDDHIALAPEHLLGMPESGVCVELYKEDFKDKTIPRVLRLVKYMAECPICGAEVLLDKGEPDYLYSMESIVSGFNPNEKYYYVRGSQPPDADNPYGKNFISGYLLKVE